MNNIKKILVPVDFSATSEAALRYVTGLITKSEDTQVTLLHVCTPGLSADVVKETERQLSELVSQWSGHIPHRDQRIEAGNLAEVIVKEDVFFKGNETETISSGSPAKTSLTSRPSDSR